MEIIILTIVGFLLMFSGLAGVALPFLPGIFLSWLGFFLYAWAGGFEKISLATTLIFLGLALFCAIFDYLAPLIGAKRYKASKFGLLGAAVGLLFGIFLFGPLGIVLGPFLGALFGEFYVKKDIFGAIKPAFGTFLGFLVSVLAKIIIIFIMIGFAIASLI
jgi:hypothetical protein